MNLFLSAYRFEKEMSEIGVIELFKKIELPLSKVLAKMEIEGISLDVEMLHSFSSDLTQKLSCITSKIYDLAAVQGGNTAFTEVDKIINLYKKYELSLWGLISCTVIIFPKEKHYQKCSCKIVLGRLVERIKKISLIVII